MLVRRFGRASAAGSSRPGPCSAARPGITIRRGRLTDYAALARFHYRAGRPPGGSTVLLARDRARGGAIAGILVASPPVLNAPWRARAWPADPASAVGGTPDRASAARALNARLRVISRVVIDPRYRGLGLATALVSAYLRRPVTTRTEALAAMGSLCPFFDRAGMRRVPIPPSRRDQRLAHDLAALGIDPLRLAAPWALPARLRRSRRLARAIRRWAAGSAATRRRAASTPLTALMVRAASSSLPRWAWVHERAVRAERRSRPRC